MASSEDLKNKWLESDWSKKVPYRLEVPFETVLAGVLIRGRIDAIYKTENGFEVVDWKTGSKKLSEAAAIQLAMYRLAWSRNRWGRCWHRKCGIPLRAYRTG
jgi:DNA helicase-2/ATP-dependent DNA helicase PcrA